jgi:hypothetical protein
VEPFTIQCTTCKARLIVKDESAIGDILACPKCHSMVQVVPPVGWKRPGGDSSPDQAAAAEADQPLPTAAPAKRLAPQKAAAVIPPALPPRNSTENVASDSVRTPTAGEFEAATRSMAASNWRLSGGGLVAGVVLGAAVWWVVATMSPAPQIVADTPGSTPETIDQAPPAPASHPEPQPLQDHSASTAESAPTAAPAPPAATLSEADPPIESVAENSLNTSAEGPAETGEAAPTADSEAAAKDSGPALKLEPVATPTIVAGGGASEVATGAPPLGPSAVDTPPEDEAPEAAAEAPSPEQPARLARDEIERRLGVALAEVEFADVTLAQFATFIEDVTGVPVTFDDSALSRAGLGRGTKVTVALRATTADAALRAATERAGLAYTVSDDGRIVVTAHNR